MRHSLGVLQLVSRAKVIEIRIGSQGEGPIFQDPPSPDYVPGPEEPEQAPSSPIYIPFVPEPVYPEFLPVDGELTRNHTLAYHIRLGCPYDKSALHHPSPTTTYYQSPPPISPTYVEGSMGSRAAGIRQRDALPVHETEMPEMCLPLRKRPCRTTPGPGCERPLLDAGVSRELGYGIRDTWDDLVGAIQEIAPTTLEGVNQRVIELSSTVDQEDKIIYSQLDDATDLPQIATALLIEEEARLSRAAWARSMDAAIGHSGGISLRLRSWLSSPRSLSCRQQTVGLAGRWRVDYVLLKADYLERQVDS
ncbi:hypothetical protein Tco_0294823 [Tanacetum coccineum]